MMVKIKVLRDSVVLGRWMEPGEVREVSEKQARMLAEQGVPVVTVDADGEERPVQMALPTGGDKKTTARAGKAKAEGAPPADDETELSPAEGEQADGEDTE